MSRDTILWIVFLLVLLLISSWVIYLHESFDLDCLKATAKTRCENMELEEEGISIYYGGWGFKCQLVDEFNKFEKGICDSR